MRAAIPFSRSSVTPAEIAAVVDALTGDHHAGNGLYTARCHETLGVMFPACHALVTSSCTAALEMAALILELAPGDEVIMPSWTFASTANAVVLRGAVPVFVDVDPATLNIDVGQAEAAITSRTRAIFCVHYAGVGCDMDGLTAICGRYGLALVEDAAQAVGATWSGKPLGSFGDFGTLSFHASKNISCGEGGALLVKSDAHMAVAEMLWEKGTDRVNFGRGTVPFYEWRTHGSSFLPSEITAALLSAALIDSPRRTGKRIDAWNVYDRELRSIGFDEHFVLPRIPDPAGHNGHIYHLRSPSPEIRDRLKTHLASRGVSATTHYQSLHLSEAGQRFGRVNGELAVTTHASQTLLRLPLDALTTEAEQAQVVEACASAIATLGFVRPN